MIEDRFAARRPAWELAGAQLTDDVTPYELMKLRILNGSHSTLAYLGASARATARSPTPSPTTGCGRSRPRSSATT